MSNSRTSGFIGYLAAFDEQVRPLKVVWFLRLFLGVDHADASVAAIEVNADGLVAIVFADNPDPVDALKRFVLDPVTHTRCTG